MRKGDIALLITAVIFLILWLIPNPQGGTVTIRVNGEIYKEVSLSENCEIPIETKMGKNIVIIRDGEVSVIGSDCPDRLCERGKICKGGESIVCLPNRVSITINGKKQKEEIDVII